MHSLGPTRDRSLAVLPIKDLFNKRQYKQCAQHCLSILECSSTTVHPLHETFLQFYAASSYEMQARLLPEIAASKLPTLHSAEHHYHEALDALSKIKLRLPETPEETSSSDNSTRPSTSTSSSSSPSSLSTISLLSCSDSVFSDEFRASPSPSRPPTDNCPTAPSAHKPASHLPTPQSSYSTSPPLPTTLTTLTASLHAHIARTAHLQHSTARAQTCRDAIRARLGCDNSASTADAASCAERIRVYDRMRRIEECRARGWRRERYDGRRVREVSERAVGELGA